MSMDFNLNYRAPYSITFRLGFGRARLLCLSCLQFLHFRLVAVMLQHPQKWMGPGALIAAILKEDYRVYELHLFRQLRHLL